MNSKDFTKAYFRFDEQDAIAYAVNVLNYFPSEDALKCTEIGDGNLNYIFKVYDSSGKSVIIKQAGPSARISSDIHLSPDRNRIEADILKIQYELTDGQVPEVYKYDPVMNCTAMEDLSDHTILRKALLDYKIFPLLDQHLAKFMVKTLLPTTDLVMNHQDKKAYVKSFINPELCDISEDLVFTEPYYDCTRNDMLEATKAFVAQEVWQDEELQVIVAKMKFHFMTCAEALIHGDLHSGSIFAKADSTKVIDPEFAFYGPAGYDIGNVLAHFIFSILNAKYAERAPQEFKDWILNTLGSTLDLFIAVYKEEWDRLVTERTAQSAAFKKEYLQNLLKDTAAYAGLEINRRIIGLAHVADITSLPEIERIRAEQEALQIGKQLLKKSDTFMSGADYQALFTN